MPYHLDYEKAYIKSIPAKFNESDIYTLYMLAKMIEPGTTEAIMWGAKVEALITEFRFLHRMIDEAENEA